MSRDATLALFKATRAALITYQDISSEVGTRVSIDWGGDLTAPFIRLSVPSVQQFEDDCGDGSEYTLRIHIFAKDIIVAGKLAASVREALQDAKLSLDGADLWWLTYDQTINLQDGDDPTLRMAVVSFTDVTTS